METPEEEHGDGVPSCRGAPNDWHRRGTSELMREKRKKPDFSRCRAGPGDLWRRAPSQEYEIQPITRPSICRGRKMRWQKCHFGHEERNSDGAKKVVEKRIRPPKAPASTERSAATGEKYARAEADASKMPCADLRNWAKASQRGGRAGQARPAPTTHK